jgi:hypothetical protein
MQSIGLACGKELGQEGSGAVVPCDVSFFIGVKPLFCLPQE